MDTVVAAGSVLIALVMFASGTPKALGQQSAIDRIVALGYSRTAGRVIGAVEVLGAIGLLVGFIWPVIGVLAVIGCALLLAGAATSHLRARDGLVHALPAVVVGMLAAATAGMYLAAWPQ